MVGDNANQNPPPYHPWLVPDVVIVPGIVHDMPRHPEKFYQNLTLTEKIRLKTTLRNSYFQ
jgi:hypothetical protein